MTPTDITGSSTAKDCQIFVYKPAFLISVTTMSSHSRRTSSGSGLAVWIFGELTPASPGILGECDDIVVTEIKKAGLYTKIWQSFAVLLPVMSVGVMGDQRTYACTCAIRAVHSEDGMTADWVPLPHEVLKTISSRIVNEVKGVNRVVYDIT